MSIYTEDDLVYAASARCVCGAGLASGPMCIEPPFTVPSYWDCSAILLGKAAYRGEPEAAIHTDRLPFSMWDIRSEFHPEAEGRTTRPLRFVLGGRSG